MIKRFLFSLFHGWQTRNIWNMPKKQPCPQCGGLRPRGRRLVGAEYHCNKCKKDFHVWRQLILK